MDAFGAIGGELVEEALEGQAQAAPRAEGHRRGPLGADKWERGSLSTFLGQSLWKMRHSLPPPRGEGHFDFPLKFLTKIEMPKKIRRLRGLPNPGPKTSQSLQREKNHSVTPPPPFIVRLGELKKKTTEGSRVACQFLIPSYTFPKTIIFMAHPKE